MRKSLVFLLVLIGCVLGCSLPDGDTTGQASAGLDAAGDRLAPLVLHGDDGSVVTLGWIDQQSGQRCDFRTVAGQTYCLPQGQIGKTSSYSDAGCLTPITSAAPSPKSPIVDVKLTGVYHAGAEYKGPLNVYSAASGCQNAGSCEGNCFALVPVADDEYVTGVMTW